MGIKKENMTPEQIEQMNERLKAMREKAAERKKELGEVTKTKKELKEQIYEQKKQEVLELKKQLAPIEQPQPQQLTQQPPKPIDEDALRKQIKAELKAKYKTKYQQPNYPYFPYYPYGAPPPQPPVKEVVQPVVMTPPDTSTYVKSIARDELSKKMNDDMLKLAMKSIFG